MQRFRQLLHWVENNLSAFKRQIRLERLELEYEFRSALDAAGPDLMLFAGISFIFQPIASVGEDGRIWASVMDAERLSWLHDPDRTNEFISPPTYPEDFWGFGFCPTLECSFALAKQEYINQVIDPDPGKLLVEPLGGDITEEPISQV